MKLVMSPILLFAFILGCCVDDVVSLCNTDPNAYSEFAVRRCIETPGLFKERCYYLFTPPCAAAAATVPLVLDIHGYGGCPETNFVYSGWLGQAAKECFIVVNPTGNTSPLLGVLPCWNIPFGSLLPSKDYDTEQCCCKTKGGTEGGYTDTDLDDTQDPLFLRNVAIDVVDHLSTTKTKIDTKRIYMAGHSNGCIASLAMAALNSDIVAAVACHAGALITPFDSSPNNDNPYSPVPIWRVHGGSDPTIPFDGSVNADAESFFPFNNATDYIVMKNGCSPNATTVTAVTDINGKNVGTSLTYSTDCVNNAIVQAIVLPNSDHTPYFNRSDTAMMGFTKPYTTYEDLTLVDTTQMAWDFCSLHSKPTIPEVFLMQSEEKPTMTITSDTTMKTAAPQEEAKETENNDQQQASTTKNPTTSAGETISKTTILPTGVFFALLFLFTLY